MLAITYFEGFVWKIPVFCSVAMLQLVGQIWWPLLGLFACNISCGAPWVTGILELPFAVKR